MKQYNDTNYILEYISLGNSVKVTAIDPVTGIESTIIGVPSLSKQQLADAAIRKLRYVIQKKQDKKLKESDNAGDE